ncbi:MAG: S8 family serine peptidase [Acidobacteria bacterium]|nr:S8 family serine peptidase [Acidobacteriota bacterium]MCA1627050.1 S8 family serine peptidase [Acidobacteriota bacterium]
MNEDHDDQTPAGRPRPNSSDSEADCPRLNEINDSKSGRFGPPPASPKDAWQPGLIEVELKQSPFPGLSVANFADKTEMTAYPAAWSNALKHVLDEHGLKHLEISFPLLHPWSEESEEEALKFYRASGRDRYITLHFPADADVALIAGELRQFPEIVRAAPVPRLVPPSFLTNEPLLGDTDQLTTTVCRPNGGIDNQWYIFRCRANHAWRKASGKGVIIADIDWGFNLFHEELNNRRVEFTYNTFTNRPGVAEGNRLDHGTAVLGLAGAGANTRGMQGFAHEAALWAIQAGSESVEEHRFWVSALDLVRGRTGDGRRKVVLLEIQTRSLRNVEMCGTIRKAIVDAICSGVVVCVPAGNGGHDAGVGDDGEPIPPTGSVLVGATKYAGLTNVRDYSNVGNRIVIYAPGDVAHDLTCSFPGDCDYRNRFGGTSGATPKVAGTVALMLQVNGTLTNAQVRDILKRSTLPVIDASSNRVGVLLNSEQAVSEAQRPAMRSSRHAFEVIQEECRALARRARRLLGL